MTQYLGNFTYSEVTISNGQTVSNAVDLKGQVIVQIIMPSAFTGTAITFQSSHNDGTYQALYNSSNTQLSITIGTSRTYNINPSDFAGCRYFKVVSGSAEGAARVIGIVTREAM